MSHLFVSALAIFAFSRVSSSACTDSFTVKVPRSAFVPRSVGSGESVVVTCASEASVSADSWPCSAGKYFTFEVYLEGTPASLAGVPKYDASRVVRRAPLYVCDRCSVANAPKSTINMTSHDILDWFVVVYNKNELCGSTLSFSATVSINLQTPDPSCNGRGVYLPAAKPPRCNCSATWAGSGCDVCAAGRAGSACQFAGIDTSFVARNRQPAVLVHGLFGWGSSEMGGQPYWGSALSAPHPIPLLEASVGPVSSAWDRACELLAQIKGVRVFYGDVHSKAAGHAAYGKNYTENGLYPEWSAIAPIHLIGHSLGGPTIRMAQQLLADDHYGWGSTADWVVSLHGISAVHSGTSLVYQFGNNESTGLAHGEVFGAAVVTTVGWQTALSTTSGGTTSAVYDFDLDHWNASDPDITGGPRPGETQLQYAKRLSLGLASSEFANGKDNALFELSFQGGEETCARTRTYASTYCFNYATDYTVKVPLAGTYVPKPNIFPPFLETSSYIGTKTFAKPPLVNVSAWPNDSAWFANDGAATTYGAIVPRWSPERHPYGGAFDLKNSIDSAFQPGRWYSVVVNADHVDVAGSNGASQGGESWLIAFYTRLFQRIASHPVSSSVATHFVNTEGSVSVRRTAVHALHRLATVAAGNNSNVGIESEVAGAIDAVSLTTEDILAAAGHHADISAAIGALVLTTLFTFLITLLGTTAYHRRASIQRQVHRMNASRGAKTQLTQESQGPTQNHKLSFLHGDSVDNGSYQELAETPSP